MRADISRLKARAEAERQRARSGSSEEPSRPGNQAERRRGDRFRPGAEIFVVPSGAPDRELRLEQVLGEVEDLGRGGLCFLRMGSYPLDPRGVSRVDLIQAGAGLRLAAVGCELVYDRAEADSGVRRCGLRFVGLDSRQRSQLRELVRP